MSYNFEELCLPCYPELVAYATKRTRSKAAAEDIVQDAIVKAYSSWDTWQPQGEPQQWARAWMFRIVANVFATAYSRNKHHDRIIENEASTVTNELHGCEATLHPYLTHDTLGDEVREALDRIRPEWAETIKLVYIEGVPSKEAAAQLGIPFGTIRSRMARGRLALARILSPFARQRFGFSADSVGSGADEAGSTAEISCASNTRGYADCKLTDKAHTDNHVCTPA